MQTLGVNGLMRPVHIHCDRVRAKLKANGLLNAAAARRRHASCAELVWEAPRGVGLFTRAGKAHQQMVPTPSGMWYSFTFGWCFLRGAYQTGCTTFFVLLLCGLVNDCEKERAAYIV